MALALCPWRGNSGERPVAGHILSLLVSKQRDDASVPTLKKDLSLSSLRQEPKWVLALENEDGDFPGRGYLESGDLPSLADVGEETAVTSMSENLQKGAFAKSAAPPVRYAFMSSSPPNEMPPELVRNPSSDRPRGMRNGTNGSSFGSNHGAPEDRSSDGRKNSAGAERPDGVPPAKGKGTSRPSDIQRPADAAGEDRKGVRGAPPARSSQAVFHAEVRIVRMEHDRSADSIPSTEDRVEHGEKRRTDLVERMVNRTVKGLVGRLLGD